MQYTDISFSPDFFLNDHITALGKTESEKLGVHNRLREFSRQFSSWPFIMAQSVLLLIITHMCGDIPLITEWLVKWKPKQSDINSPTLTNLFQSLFTCCDVASLSLLNHYHHDHYSSETFQCQPDPFRRLCCPCYTMQHHPYCVHLPQQRINKYKNSFSYSTSKVWNYLTSMPSPHPTT